LQFTGGWFQLSTDNVTQWAVPKLWFEISGFTSHPEQPQWHHAESKAAMVGGYAW
jgi:hypothetical protein